MEDFLNINLKIKFQVFILNSHHFSLFKKPFIINNLKLFFLYKKPKIHLFLINHFHLYQLSILSVKYFKTKIEN